MSVTSQLQKHFSILSPSSEFFFLCGILSNQVATVMSHLSLNIFINSNLVGNACNETNLMHYVSSVYSVTIPLHVSGLLVAHHLEVTMYNVYMQQMVCVIRFSRRSAGLVESHLNQVS
jgi:hypothetical protein